LSATSKAEIRLPISFKLPPVLLWVGVGEGILMWLTVKYLELVRIFKEASRNYKSTFQDIEDAKKFLNAIGAYTESIDFIFKAFKKIIHLMTLSL
jgi:hypothetical protein